jgi:peroxiredoxin
MLGMSKRVTFVIDKEGKIRGVFDSSIFAAQHLDGVKATIASLAKP